MLAFLKYWQIGAGAALGALLAYWPAHFLGEQQGRQQAAVESLRADLDAERKRTEDDAKMQSLDDYHFCVQSLRRRGLSVDQCEQLRGVQEGEP